MRAWQNRPQDNQPPQTLAAAPKPVPQGYALRDGAVTMMDEELLGNHEDWDRLSSLIHTIIWAFMEP